jgi:hypothetical protein
LIAFASLTMVVSAMAHSTAAATKGETGQCADAKRQPYPIAAKPVHRRVPFEAILSLMIGAIA